MNIKKNIILFTIAVLISLGTYYLPQTWSAEAHQQRLLATTYNTNPNRMASIAKFCKNVKKSQIISTDQVQTSKTYKNQLASQFTVTGNTLINKVINGGDAIGDIQKDIVPLALFAGVFALGYIIMLTSCSFLFCCCCCPGCCPSKCCQKNQNQQYTKCQLYWPAITLILALLTIVAGGAIGFSRASAFTDGLQDMGCAVSILFDDLFNGNVTADGNNFFIGIKNLGTELTLMGTNIGGIQTQIDKIKNVSGTQIYTIFGNVPITQTSISKVPTGTAGTVNTTLSYSKSFLVYPPDGTSSTLLSGIGLILGSQSNGGIIGNLYTSIGQIKTDLTGIQAKASTFSASAGTFSGKVAAITANLNQLQTSTDKFNDLLTSSLSALDLPKQMGTMIFQIIYAVAMGIAILALVGVVLMVFCDMYKCRYLMYFSCSILFIFGIISFLLSIIFSILVPFLYWGCDWLSYTLGDSANFQTNMAPYLDSATTGYIAPCLKGSPSGGDFITAVAPTAASTIFDLKSNVDNINTYNVTQKISILDASLTIVSDTINDRHIGKVADFVDTGMENVMKKIANPTNYPGCTDLQTDSWAVAPNSYAPCNLGTPTAYKTAAAGQCDSTTVISTYANTACRGCMDSTAIFNTLLSSSPSISDWSNVLTARYTGVHADCTAFKNQFGNVWKNYYYLKVPKFTQIKTDWDDAFTNHITPLRNSLVSLGVTMTQIKGNLSTLVDSITDPKYGLVAGLNCKLIGQDIDLFVSSICTSNFNTFYITRIAMGIISFGILMSLFCIVCSGVRHFKHSQRKQKVTPVFQKSKNSFEDTDAAFKP